MHTYHHEPTGIRFHYNSDLSGDITVTVPAKGTKSYHTVEIPAEALTGFVCSVMFDTEELIAGIDRIRDWLNSHTNVVSGPVPPPEPFRWPPEKRCETCTDMPDDCYPDPPEPGGCEYHKPKKVRTE